VKRAGRPHILPLLFQGNKIPHHLHNVGLLDNLVNGFFGYAGHFSYQLSGISFSHLASEMRASARNSINERKTKLTCHSERIFWVESKSGNKPPWWVTCTAPCPMDLFKMTRKIRMMRLFCATNLYQ
jgi:hypothetical protein